MDLRQFARKMRVTGAVVQDNGDILLRKVALAVDAAVVLATPVDTGRARSNWQVELGAAPEGVREPFSEGAEGSTAGPNAQAAIAAGQAVIAQARGTDVIHITNNLTYIAALNDGSSAQAPAGFVEEAVHAGVKQVNDARVTIEGGVK
jgi:hypothetical protein